MMRVELLHVQDCPHLDDARRLVLGCLDDLGIRRTAFVERSGAFSSPSVLVNGIDVMGAPDVVSASCRLDVPTRDLVLAALRATAAGDDATAGDAWVPAE